MAEMGRRRAAVLAIVAVLALVPASAPDVASAGSTSTAVCGGVWTGSAQCRFQFKGWPIRVAGGAGGLPAAVHAWVELRTLPFTSDPMPPVPAGPTLIACAGAGADQATCGEKLAGTGDAIAPGTWLLCRVHGTQGGAYLCSSGS